ncbi:MAG: hypothetical protein PF692_01730 [Kiritimatiellae bacterium]|jgi:hypothetical protein|nr:hypothetical protein [Kiritimatiellia bacterium]
MEHETQPLDKILDELNISNHDLVAASDEHLTHKMVKKGRKGKTISRRIHFKILNALNSVTPDDSYEYKIKDLFTY